MAGELILRALSGVRSRLRRRRAVHGAAWGLLAAAAVGTVLGFVRFMGWLALPGWTPALLLLGPIVGAAAAMLRGLHWEAAAKAVDAHYRLKDRATTALAFLHRPTGGRWESLQIEDAAKHLSSVKPEQVVPARWPRSLSFALAAVAAAVLLLLWPLAAPPVQAAPVGPNAGLLAMAADLDEDLDELEETAKERQDEELIELVKELREQTEALQEEGVELKEALATLSEMQASLRQHAEYNQALVDAQLSNLAGAMATAEELQPTAEKLEAGDHTAAAEELEKLEKPGEGRRAEKAAAERMKKLAQEMSGKGLGALGGSVSEMAEGLSSGSSSKFCEGCKSLSSLLRKHDARKKMSSLMLRQLDKLNECKGQCSMCFGGMCKKCGSSQCQGQCNKNSLAEGQNRKKSDKSSTNWGKSTSGNLYGDKTDLASNGKQEQLTGQAGEGPSEIETTTSPEGREQAGRGYKERYEKYRKLSEEVLDGEPIPLGHRQTIRNYFELIRPQEGDDT
ncbi:MAG: hypothetical protein WBC44_17845 [Planctomycetaceae bacterium]